MPERSARPSASFSSAERGLDAVQLVAADAERVEDLRALEIGEVAGLDDARAPRSAARAPRGARRGASACGRRRRAPEPRARARRSRAQRGRATRTRPRRPRCWCASIIASARASAPSSRPRSSVATPFARKPGVDSRAGRRATRSSRASGASCRARSGRRTPSRSARPRARSASARRRRAADEAALRGGGRGTAWLGCGSAVVSGHAAGEVNLTLHQSARCPPGHPPKRACFMRKCQ